jgi:purine-binding chemotaxis protein CheW
VSTNDALDKFIVFTLAGTNYALRSRDVLHIEMMDLVTPVPNAAPFVEGIVFSRGEVVPVVNLRVRFGFERAPIDLRSRLLVVGDETRRVGLLVDGAREFITIPASAIQPPHEAITGLSGRYLEGVATLGPRIILVLDLPQVLAFPVDTLPAQDPGVAEDRQ